MDKVPLHRIDPEERLRMTAWLKEQYPRLLLSQRADMIDWASLRYTSETREQYAERMHGPMEPLP